MTSIEPRLTDEERLILTLVARGHTDAAAARLLRVSPRTIRRRLEEAMSHLGAHTRMQAAVLAVKAGLIE